MVKTLLHTVHLGLLHLSSYSGLVGLWLMHSCAFFSEVVVCQKVGAVLAVEVSPTEVVSVSKVCA